MQQNLENPSQNNLKYMLKSLAKKLDVANSIVFDEKGYSLDHYSELKLLYDHVIQSDRLSPSEVQALIDELSKIRR